MSCLSKTKALALVAEEVDDAQRLTAEAHRFHHEATRSLKYEVERLKMAQARFDDIVDSIRLCASHVLGHWGE